MPVAAGNLLCFGAEAHRSLANHAITSHPCLLVEVQTLDPQVSSLLRTKPACVVRGVEADVLEADPRAEGTLGCGHGVLVGAVRQSGPVVVRVRESCFRETKVD
jgi:hypothetical protein